MFSRENTAAVVTLEKQISTSIQVCTKSKAYLGTRPIPVITVSAISVAIVISSRELGKRYDVSAPPRPTTARQVKGEAGTHINAIVQSTVLRNRHDDWLVISSCVDRTHSIGSSREPIRHICSYNTVLSFAIDALFIRDHRSALSAHEVRRPNKP
jgi:hypothetical protein